MIILTILFIILSLVLTPVLLLLFSVQSNHILYKLAGFLFILLYSGCILLSHGHHGVGLLIFGILIFLWQLTIYIRTQRASAYSTKKYIIGDIQFKSKLSPIKILISLWPLYFIRHLPFPITINKKNKKLKLNLQKLISQILELGSEMNLDAKVKDLAVHFKVV